VKLFLQNSNLYDHDTSTLQAKTIILDLQCTLYSCITTKHKANILFHTLRVSVYTNVGTLLYNLEPAQKRSMLEQQATKVA